MTPLQAKKMYAAWLKEKVKLDATKKKELELRLKICTHVLGDKIKGTVTDKSIDGFIVKAVAKLNYKVDQDKVNSRFSMMTENEQKCFKWVADLVSKEFKVFEESESRLLDLVTIKPGTPSLEIETEEGE